MTCEPPRYARRDPWLFEPTPHTPTVGKPCLRIDAAGRRAAAAAIAKPTSVETFAGNAWIEALNVDLARRGVEIGDLIIDRLPDGGR